ncbi:defensin, isoforms B and C-like [Branchiostoma floridae x Branchiostoma belcheri]
MKFLVVALVLAVLANAEAKPKMAAQPRITCDLLSFSFGGASFGDAACAAHCLVLGNRGGYCNNENVCVCRN